MIKVQKQNKLLYYLKGYGRPFLPIKSLEKEITALSKNLSKIEKETVEKRVNYYIKINNSFSLSKNSLSVKDLMHPKSPKSYYFDTFEFARYFPKSSRLDVAFGDVNTILETPGICKSRPIKGGNENNVLLNLDKARHFVSVKDTFKYEDKFDKIVGRAAIHQQNRKDFYSLYFDNPLCDLGQINEKGGEDKWIKAKIPISEHLKYKFILSLEGNDVATNLKWIMSSNSIAVSPPLKMETWYMEGTLISDEHFIGLDENFKNLEEKLSYYIERPKEALEIIENAKRFRNQFNNKNLEKLISLLVLKKYFDYIRDTN